MSLPKILDRGNCRKDIVMAHGMCWCIPFCAYEKDGKTPMNLNWKHVRLTFYTNSWWSKWSAYIHQNSSGNLPWNYIYEANLQPEDLENRISGKWEFPMRCGQIPWRWWLAVNDTWNRTWLSAWDCCCYRIRCYDRSDPTNQIQTLIQYWEICFINTTECWKRPF